MNILLSGCEPLMELDPKGPQAQTQAIDIMLSIWIMSLIVLVVFLMLGYMLIRYRASIKSRGYEPPNIKSSVIN